MARLFQFGTLGSPPEYKGFFKAPAITVDEMRQLMGNETQGQAIGLGAVVDPSGAISGEMVMVDGHAYKVGTDGVVMLIPENHRISFAQIGHMEPQNKFTVCASSLAELQDRLQKLLPDDAQAYMVRAVGKFEQITFRGTDTRGRKFQALDTLLNDSSCASLKNYDHLSCQLVGFYSKPKAIEAGVTLENTLHLHGVDNRQAFGGHLIDFKGNTTLQIEIMPITQWLTATRDAHQKQRNNLPPNRWTNRLCCPSHDCKPSR